MAKPSGKTTGGKTSGGLNIFGFDLASQSWMVYMAFVFVLFYGFRLFKMAQGKINPQKKDKKDAKASVAAPETIPEEEKEPAVTGEEETETEELVPKLFEEEKEAEVEVEEKKTK